jgi:hypothetical protein
LYLSVYIKDSDTYAERDGKPPPPKKQILQMKAKSSSETPVNSYQTTRSHIAEDSNCRDNLQLSAFYYLWQTTMNKYSWNS